MEISYIEASGLSFSYKTGGEVLKKISFHAAAKEAVGFVGANGAGKSTLLKLLVGLDLNYAGIIKVNGLFVEKKNLPKIREKTGYVFQDSESQLFMSTAYEDTAFAPRNYGLPEPEVQRRVHAALTQAGALHLKDRHIYQMSSGEKKLVSIASVLSMEPEILLMDEPSAALDPGNRRNLIRLLNSFTQLKLITSHDLDFILDTCTRVILLDQGEIIRDGAAKEILTDEKLLEAHGLELPLSLYKKSETVSKAENT